MTDTNIVIQLARIEEKLDAYLFRTGATEARIADHDTRLRAVETNTAKILGIAGGLAFIVSLAAQLIPVG